MNYYERHIGDYTRDTAHLSLLEHGAYTLLMDRYYTTERGVSDEEKYKVARARSRSEKNAVDSVLKEFFTLEGGEGGVWRQKRCEEVLKEFHDFVESQRAAGRASAAKRALNSGSTGVQQPFNRRGNRKATEGQPEGNLPPPTSHLPPPKEEVRAERARTREASAGEGNGGSEPSPAHDLTERIKAVYPAGTYRASNWILAERAISKLLDDGEGRDALLAHARAFAEQQLAKGSTGTQFVLSPEKFFGPDGHWRGPFPLPQSSAPKVQRLKSATEIAEEYEARERQAAGATP